jgi:uncharacterized membrane protein YdjX (TVP38/TMEM64 family)
MISLRGQWAHIFWESAKSFLGVLALFLLIIITGVIIARYIDVPALRGLVQSFGALSPLIGLTLVALRSMLFLPILPMPVVIGLASLIFGKLHGALYAWLGTTIGACLAFMLARRFLGNRTVTLREGRLKRLHEAAGAHGLLATIGFRLLLYSNVVLNYGSAATSLTLKDYALGTFIGLVPRSFLVPYVFEISQEPDVLMALMTLPSLSLLHLLLLSNITGVVLLALLVRQAYWATKEAAPDPSR